MSELESRLDFLEAELIRNNVALRADFNKFITEELIDTVRDKLTGIEEIQSLIEDAVKKTPLIEELKTVRHLYHAEKKEKSLLRIENNNLQMRRNQDIYGTNPKLNAAIDQINELTRALERLNTQVEKAIDSQNTRVANIERMAIQNALETKAIYFYLEDQGLTKEILFEKLKQAEKDTQAKIESRLNGKASAVDNFIPTEQINVKRVDIEEQGEIYVIRPSDFSRTAFRDSVKLNGLSKRGLAKYLGVPVNTMGRIKGRIQDYIAEMHPDKKIYMKARLVGYGDDGEDVVLYFPLFISYSLLQIPESETKPWPQNIRRAILNGSAKIIG